MPCSKETTHFNDTLVAGWEEASKSTLLLFEELKPGLNQDGPSATPNKLGLKRP